MGLQWARPRMPLTASPSVWLRLPRAGACCTLIYYPSLHLLRCDSRSHQPTNQPTNSRRHAPALAWNVPGRPGAWGQTPSRPHSARSRIILLAAHSRRHMRLLACCRTSLRNIAIWEMADPHPSAAWQSRTRQPGSQGSPSACSSARARTCATQYAGSTSPPRVEVV